MVEKFSFSELKIEKVKFFTQSSTKIFCNSVFNFGGCLASCLAFRPLGTSLLIKKIVCSHLLISVFMKAQTTQLQCRKVVYKDFKNFKEREFLAVVKLNNLCWKSNDSKHNLENLSYQF